jgi:N-carbamoylputrescine amidase
MTAEHSFRVGLVQMSMSTAPAENLAKASAFVREAAERGAQVVCLPELFRSRYFCQSEDHAAFALAESVPGPSTEALGRLAREKAVALLVPVFERRAPGVYHNSVVILDDQGRIAGLYRKMHIPDDPLFYEKFYFTPGDLGFQAFDVGPARIGALVCWDQWYPEAARLTALRGAAVLFYPTAIGWHPSEKAEAGAEQRSAWQTIQRSHAIANGVYVAAVNRVGREVSPEGGDGLEFWGGSFLADPFGVVLAEASPDREEVLVGEVSLSRIEQVRTQWPFLRDRRIDAYAGIDQRLLDRE